jgi:DNA-binding response OmpR family regulator
VASQTILVIEDEKEISDIIEIYLKSRNYHVVTAEDGLVALNKFEQLQPDLIILDILMPNMDGIEFCKQIRQVSNVPILFMSCKKDPEDVIHGLSIGGDDYITKPFDPNVLVARVEANLRRAPILKRWSSSPPPAPILQPLKFGELEIDLQHLRVLLRGVNVSLSNKEMQLLIYLAQHPGKIFTQEELYSSVWDMESNSDTRTISVHISNIRKKIEDDPQNPVYIQNIRGSGYKFM